MAARPFTTLVSSSVFSILLSAGSQLLLAAAVAVTVVCPPPFAVVPWASNLSVAFSWGDSSGAFPAVSLGATLVNVTSGVPLTESISARFAWSVLARPSSSQSTSAPVSQADQFSPVASFTPDAPGTYVLSLVVDDGCGRAVGNVTLEVACGGALSAVLQVPTVFLRSGPGLDAPFNGFGAFPPLPLSPLAAGSMYPPWAATLWTIQSAPVGSLAGLLDVKHLNMSRSWAAGTYPLAPLATFVDTFGNTSVVPFLLADLPGEYIVQVRGYCMAPHFLCVISPPIGT